MVLKPFLTVYLVHRFQKPFKRFPVLVVPGHRAEATVLMKSLRVTMLSAFQRPSSSKHVLAMVTKCSLSVNP
jgi:hypothetical protein